MNKEVKKHLGSKNFYLFVLEQLKTGVRPSKICTNLGISKQALNYYLSSLKKEGLISKLGYGVWEVKEVKEVKKHLADRLQHPVSIEALKQDQVRAHAFQFTLSLPKDLRNWDKRKELLQTAGITFKDMPNVFGGAELIEFKGKKVILTNKSIVVNEPKDYLTETADNAKSYAVNNFLVFIRSLENYLKANFSYGGQYKFKVTRQHYALVKNALAKQYDKEGKKLEVYQAGELWFLIDNSFNLHEAETVHPVTASGDNKKVQDFFNGIKQVEGFTPQFVTNAIAQSVQCSIQNAQNLDHYAIHLKAHVESVQKLGTAVEQLTKIIARLENGNN
jgi:DNA-binding transcriptional ArsR family regulator